MFNVPPGSFWLLILMHKNRDDLMEELLNKTKRKEMEVWWHGKCPDCSQLKINKNVFKKRPKINGDNKNDHYMNRLWNYNTHTLCCEWCGKFAKEETEIFVFIQWEI